MTSRRPLSEADALAQLAFLVVGTIDAQASVHDLSLVQTRLLGVLRDRAPTMNELAGLLSLDKSSATGLVDRAERRGLVTRVPSVKDRRVVQVELTAQGRQLVSEVATAFDAEIRSLLAGLSRSDRSDLTNLAGRLVEANAAERGIDLFATIENHQEG